MKNFIVVGGRSGIGRQLSLKLEAAGPFHSSVAVAKGAVEGLTRSLAAELSPEIRVNAIAPSIVDTPLAQRLLSSPERIAAAQERHPVKQIGSADQVARLASALLQGELNWATGQIFHLDGGISAVRK